MRSLIKRDPNYVSKEDQMKAEREVEVADAERDVQQTEVREVELRIRQAMRRQSQTRWAGGEKWSLGLSRAPLPPLEQKLREMDRKLDRLIEAVEGLAREKAHPVLPK